MTRYARVILSFATVLAVSVLCCISAVTMYFFGGFNTPASGLDNPVACGQGGIVAPDGDLPSISPLASDQVRDAAIIIRVGQERNVPLRGWVIAVATSLQESGLHNLPDLGTRNDHDSIGLFQQRPSQGWGTPAQLSDPVYAAGKFYQKLVTVPDWQVIPLTDAAQAVQHSAYPNAYAKHEPLATQIVNTLVNGGASLVDMHCTAAGQVAASGWPVPVAGYGRP